jgi:hypothetical protein
MTCARPDKPGFTRVESPPASPPAAWKHEKEVAVTESPDFRDRAEELKAQAARLSEKLEALDALADTLRIRNTDLTIQLEKARENWTNGIIFTMIIALCSSD